MFTTVRRQLNRPPATGKAKIARRIMISIIFIGTFFIFQNIQFNKIDFEAQYTQIVNATDLTKEQQDGLLKNYEEKFGSLDGFFADPVFSEAPMSQRLEKSIETETMLAQQESIAARGGVILFDIFKWVIPGAVEKTDTHDQKVADFFASDTYRDSTESLMKFKDVTAAIQHCQGVSPDGENKEPYGYIENNLVSDKEKERRMNLINEAAERTLCDNIQKTKK